MTSTEGANEPAVACNPGNVLTDSDVQRVQPSGPRTVGQGVEDAQQGIVDIQLTPNGAVLLRITLLAAGFVIGYYGACIREISKVSGADIKSWTDKPTLPIDTHRPCRSFLIQGDQKALMKALEVIYDALARYKELCEGGLQGHCVSQVQLIHGIQFLYQPPPRNVVPQAAGLQGPQQRAPMQNSNESDKGKQAQHILAQIKQAIAAQKTASDQSPTAASYIPAHLPSKPSHPQLTSAQVQALSAVTGANLQTTVTENPWLNPDMRQQVVDQSVHRAQAHPSQTARSATVNAPSAMVYPSASLNYLPQPVGYSAPAFSKTSAHPIHAKCGHAADPWTQHKLQLQSAAAMNQSSVGPRQPACLPDMLTQSSVASRQPACLPDMLNSPQLRQYYSVPTSAVSNAAYQHQQLQLQAAAAAALHNAVHLHAGALQSDYRGHSFDSALSSFMPSAALRGATPVSYQTHSRISLNTALHQQHQTGHAPTACNYASSVPVMLPQHGQHQVVMAPNASMYHQLLPQQQTLLPDSEAYNRLAMYNASSVLAVPSHSPHTRQTEYLQGAYAQTNMGRPYVHSQCVYEPAAMAYDTMQSPSSSIGKYA